MTEVNFRNASIEKFGLNVSYFCILNGELYNSLEEKLSQLSQKCEQNLTFG